jgi:hypothetical protein
VTPYLLAAVERETGGRSLAANLALLEQNAALAAEIAGELTGDTGSGERNEPAASSLIPLPSSLSSP